MATIELPDGSGSERQRLWGLRPELAAAAEAFSDAIQAHSILAVSEQEAARIRIAHINGCAPCSDTRIEAMDEFGLDESFYQDVDDPDKRGRYSCRERLAIEFAERFAAGKAAFDEPFWADLRAGYSTEELVDLALSVAKWLALGRINAVFDLTVACPIRLQPSRPGSSSRPG